MLKISCDIYGTCVASGSNRRPITQKAYSSWTSICKIMVLMPLEHCFTGTVNPSANGEDLFPPFRREKEREEEKRKQRKLLHLCVHRRLRYLFLKKKEQGKHHRIRVRLHYVTRRCDISHMTV